MPSLLTLSDVMGTGHHAAVAARVAPRQGRWRWSATGRSACAASSPRGASAPSRSSSWAATRTASRWQGVRRDRRGERARRRGSGARARADRRARRPLGSRVRRHRPGHGDRDRHRARGWRGGPGRRAPLRDDRCLGHRGSTTTSRSAAARLRCAPTWRSCFPTSSRARSSPAASSTAQAFVEAGAAVVLADFKEDAVQAAAQQLVAAGHKAVAVHCDVSDDAQVAAMVDRTIAAFGRLDAAFNNAGVMARIAPTADSTREDWDRVIGVNLRGVELHEARAAADGAPGQRCNRQQRVGRRADRQPRYRLLYRLQARGGRPDADGRARIRQARHPRKCGESRPDRHADRPRRRRRGRAGVCRTGETCSDRPRGQARGDRIGRAVALQSGGELRGRPRPHRGRRYSADSCG